MSKSLQPRPLREIAYARAAIRNLIELDKTGEHPELKVGISFLNAAEGRVNAYLARRDGIDRLPDD